MLAEAYIKMFIKSEFDILNLVFKNVVKVQGNLDFSNYGLPGLHYLVDTNNLRESREKFVQHNSF